MATDNCARRDVFFLKEPLPFPKDVVVDVSQVARVKTLRGNAARTPRSVDHEAAFPLRACKQLFVGGLVGFASGYVYRKDHAVVSHVISKGFFLAQFLDHVGLVSLPWNSASKSLAGSPLNADWTLQLLSSELLSFLRKNSYVVLGYCGGYFLGNGSTSYVFVF